MKEQLISFETDKLAKEKGFNISCWNYYGTYPNESNTLNESGIKLDVNNSYWGYNAPTQSLLQKWLREEHNIRVFCIPSVVDSVDKYWQSVVYRQSQTVFTTKDIMKYEEALEKGLQEALTLI